VSAPRYDLHVRDTAHHLRLAETHLTAVSGTPAALPAWQRAQHWRRLQNAQHAGLHWFYLLTVDHAVCTCGLLETLPCAPHQCEPRGSDGTRPERDPAEAPGHLHAHTWRPVQVFLTPDSHPSDRERRVPTRPTYRMVCQRCQTHHRQLDLDTARSALTRHRLSVPHLIRTWVGA
jgi:hypothetical protein